MDRLPYVTDMQHYLDDDLSIPETLSGPALNLALFLGSIVGWVTTHFERPKMQTNVPCRRSPGNRRCTGTINAGLCEDGSTIFWECPLCCDHGVIHAWEDTPWDRQWD